MLETLGLAAEGLRVVQIGVVVLLDEGFQLNAQALAVVDHAMMVVGNTPGAGIDVVVAIKGHMLGRAAHLGVGVAASQRPAAAASFLAVLQHLDLIAGGP